MLIVTRRIGEELVIDGAIRVRVVAVDGDRVRLGTNAPRSVTVDRLEVHERRGEFAAERELSPSPRAAVGSFVESLATDLTEIAYQVALRHGLGNQWLELQLDLWEALTEAIEKRYLSVNQIQLGYEPRLNAIDQDN